MAEGRRIERMQRINERSERHSKEINETNKQTVVKNSTVKWKEKREETIKYNIYKTESSKKGGHSGDGRTKRFNSEMEATEKIKLIHTKINKINK